MLDLLSKPEIDKGEDRFLNENKSPRSPWPAELGAYAAKQNS
jgi:hypothetical protein